MKLSMDSLPCTNGSMTKMIFLTLLCFSHFLKASGSYVRGGMKGHGSRGYESQERYGGSRQDDSIYRDYGHANYRRGDIWVYGNPGYRGIESYGITDFGGGTGIFGNHGFGGSGIGIRGYGITDYVGGGFRVYDNPGYIGSGIGIGGGVIGVHGYPGYGGGGIRVYGNPGYVGSGIGVYGNPGFGGSSLPGYANTGYRGSGVGGNINSRRSNNGYRRGRCIICRRKGKRSGYGKK